MDSFSGVHILFSKCIIHKIIVVARARKLSAPTVPHAHAGLIRFAPSSIIFAGEAIEGLINAPTYTWDGGWDILCLINPKLMKENLKFYEFHPHHCRCDPFSRKCLKLIDNFKLSSATFFSAFRNHKPH